MCWNENISLNTFLFGTGSLAFIYYVSTYTQYTLVEFANPYLYLVCFSFILMQGIEFFLWKSIRTKDRVLNRAFSILGWLTLYVVQPISILLMVSHQYPSIRLLSWIAFYGAIFVLVFGYKWLTDPVKFVTTVGQQGHLYWNWNEFHGFEYMICAFYFAICLSAFLVVPWIAGYIFLLLIGSLLIYNPFSTMWCWYVNSLLLFFLVKILFILPLQM